MIQYKNRELDKESNICEKRSWKRSVLIFLGLVFLMLLFIVTILEKPFIRSEKEIVQEINDIFLANFEDTPFDEIAVEILFRDIDRERKQDRIYAKVYAQNDIVELNCCYDIEFVFQNCEWVLHQCRLDSSQYTVWDSSITEADANAQIESLYSKEGMKNLTYIWKGHWLNLESGNEAYIYSVDWEEEDGKKHEWVMVWYSFDLQKGWHFSKLTKI